MRKTLKSVHVNAPILMFCALNRTYYKLQNKKLTRCEKASRVLVLLNIKVFPTLDWVTEHTVVHHSSTSTQTPHFIGIRILWTDIQTDVPT